MAPAEAQVPGRGPASQETASLGQAELMLHQPAAPATQVAAKRVKVGPLRLGGMCPRDSGGTFSAYSEVAPGYSDCGQPSPAPPETKARRVR